MNRTSFQECLFSQESRNCNNVAREEHIIQRGLGGSLSSARIVCANCNGFFSQNLDTCLTGLYEPIMNTLAPFLSGKLKRRKKSARLTSEKSGQYKIEYIGGTANLKGISKRYSRDGRLEGIAAPASTSKKDLAEIARREGAKGKAFRTLPLTELFPGAQVKTCLNISPSLIRAVLLDIVELAYYVSVEHDFPNVAKHNCLGPLRLWTRTGVASERFPPREMFFSFAPVSDVLDSLFDPSIFSHRLAIAFDRRAKILVLIAQFVDTMPWVFVMEDVVVSPCSSSILYKKALIGGQDQLLLDQRRTIVDVRGIRWRKFSTRTRYALEFAKTKWTQEYRRQHARAHYESDLRHDSFIRDRLTHYAEECQCKTDASQVAVLRLLQNRYEGSTHLSEILEMAKKVLSERRVDHVEREEQRVFLYRECLKQVVGKFGYPKL